MKYSPDLRARLTTFAPAWGGLSLPRRSARAAAARGQHAPGRGLLRRGIGLVLVAGSLAAACSSTEGECAAWPFAGISLSVTGAAEICESGLIVEARDGERVETLECFTGSDGVCSCMGAEEPGRYEVVVREAGAAAGVELGTAGPVQINEWKCDVGPRRVSVSVDLDAARSTARSWTEACEAGAAATCD